MSKEEIKNGLQRVFNDFKNKPVLVEHVVVLQEALNNVIRGVTIIDENVSLRVEIIRNQVHLKVNFRGKDIILSRRVQSLDELVEELVELNDSNVEYYYGRNAVSYTSKMEGCL